MSESKHGFSSFIDHYILLLAARFNAPLDAVALCSTNNNNNTTTTTTNNNNNNNNNPMELWENVARCVQDVLTHPQTPAERREVAHIDASLFTAEVCRDRALYFRWRLHQQQEEEKEKDEKEQISAVSTASAAAAAPHSTGRSGKVKKNRGTAPSGFDITRDSIKDEVEAIYAAVRASLPSTLGIQRGKLAVGKNDDDDGEVPHTKNNHNNNNDRNHTIMDEYEGESDDDTEDDADVEVVEFAMRTEQEESRDRVIAEARDALLSKIQKLQAEFYAEHRRWVDVPYDLDITPEATCGATANTTITTNTTNTNSNTAAAVTAAPSSTFEGDAVGKACRVDDDIQATLQHFTADEAFPHMLSKSAMREALETSTPKKALSSNNTATPTSIVGEAAISTPTDFFEALKRSVHVKRPPRPSQMREEDYKAEYSDIVLPSLNGNDFDAAAELAIYRKATEISGIRPIAAQENEQRRQEQEQELGLRSVNAATAVESIPQRSRGNRWTVVEYDNDSDQESESMD